MEVIAIKLYESIYRVSSPYGPRVMDNGDTRTHTGIDLIGIDSKNIIAPTNGKIITSQIVTDRNNRTWEWGNYIKMDDLYGYYLFFCHLSQRIVRAGETVVKGQIIGLEGQTGYALGSHLHFEVRRISSNGTINPEEYFKILEDREIGFYKEMTQKRFGFDNNTMNFLSGHPYYHALFEKLATRE